MLTPKKRPLPHQLREKSQRKIDATMKKSKQAAIEKIKGKAKA